MIKKNGRRKNMEKIRKNKIIIPVLAGLVLCIAAFFCISDFYHSKESVQEDEGMG